MRLRKLILYSLLPLKLFSQNPNEVRGTCIITAICKDGIIMAVDSRAVFLKDSLVDLSTLSSNNVRGFYDDVQKVHIIRKFAFGSEGQLNFGNERHGIYYYLSRFEKTLSDTTDVYTGARNFMYYMRNNYGADVLDGFKSLQIVLTGYYKQIPLIAIIDPIDSTKGGYIKDSGYMTCSVGVDFPRKYSKNLTCEQMAKVVENAILEYRKKYNKELYIGSKIMILKISPQNTFTWLKNAPKEPESSTDSISETYTKYLQGKLKIQFTSPGEKLKFDSTVKAWLKIK